MLTLTNSLMFTSIWLVVHTSHDSNIHRSLVDGDPEAPCGWSSTFFFVFLCWVCGVHVVECVLKFII